MSASLIIRSGIGRARIAVYMICRACATWNREDARFCKACGRTLDDVPVAGSPRSMPGPRIPPPPAWRPRAWWHGIGVFAILAAFLVFVDASMDATVTWSYVAILGLAFLTGGILILQFLASVEKRDRRALFAGGALLAASVVLLPVAVALQSSATTTETFVVPYDPAIRNVTLDVAIEAGQIAVGFEASTEFLVRADVVHVGGLFSSHSDGDAVATNTTTGEALTFGLSARGLPALFFVGGHEVRVTVRADVSVQMTLQTTTGGVYVDIPPGVDVRGLTTSVTTGDVRLRSRDAIFANAASVVLTTTTGNVGVDLTQTAGEAGTVSVAGRSTTGGVTFQLERGPTVGALVRSSTTTGSITFDAAEYEGSPALLYAPSQDGFDAAALKLTVQLTTTTGNIGIG